MKKAIALFCLVILVSTKLYARDTISDYSIGETLSIEKFKNMLGTEVAFYFGDTPYSSNPIKNFGQFSTNKKTNAFNKSDMEACQWAFMSAMKELKERAIRVGGNAIVEIKSNYKNNLTSSRDTFQCGAGALMAGVALTGKIVQIQK